MLRRRSNSVGCERAGGLRCGDVRVAPGNAGFAAGPASPVIAGLLGASDAVEARDAGELRRARVADEGFATIDADR